MKYYIIAGEASGDMHGANLINELSQSDKEADFRFFGGDKMHKASGIFPRRHIRELAFMGFIEVVMNLKTILNHISFCKNDITEYNPDALILIDYPGFNIRMAKWAKSKGIKVFYYISPQIWAWKTQRIHTLMEVAEKMYVILPFEKEFYRKFGYHVEFVGHPLLDEIKKETFKKINSDRKIFALLPGSRKQEIGKILPVMLKQIHHFREFDFHLACSPSIPITFYQELIGKAPVKLEENNTYGLLSSAHIAWVTSGTATLETALFKVPQIVCYKGNPISYQIAKRLVKNISYISLVNLILDRELVPELIQGDLNGDMLINKTKEILEEGNRKKILQGYQELSNKLSKTNASFNVSQSVLKTLRASE